MIKQTIGELLGNNVIESILGVDLSVQQARITGDYDPLISRRGCKKIKF